MKQDPNRDYYFLSFFIMMKSLCLAARLLVVARQVWKGVWKLVTVFFVENPLENPWFSNRKCNESFKNGAEFSKWPCLGHVFCVFFGGDI